MSSDTFDAPRLFETLDAHLDAWAMTEGRRSVCRRATLHLTDVLDGVPGDTVQQRWDHFEAVVWPRWLAGEGRTLGDLWQWGVMTMVLSRHIRPSWSVLSHCSITHWTRYLPADDPLCVVRRSMTQAVKEVTWVSTDGQRGAVLLTLRLMLACGHDRLEQFTDDDLRSAPLYSRGIDVLDAILCSRGILQRTPIRGQTRRGRLERRDAAGLADAFNIPRRFQPVTVLYLDTYAERISDRYGTRSAKALALGHFWRFIDQHHADVRSCRDLTPAQVRSFIPYALELGRRNQIDPAMGDTATPHAWLSLVRSFFTDICTWATEPDSPFADHAPSVVPLTRHDLVGIGFDQVRRRSQARNAATVIELEHEMPKIRAHASLAWHDAEQALATHPDDRRVQQRELSAFWDWALLELLVQSGLRREEASELTTLDVLKRQLADGRTYYLLHVKPSKFDRARVIPIGDGLGRVIAEIVRHVKAFYRTTHVPPCDHWDPIQKEPRPRAPYLLQGVGRPYAMGVGRLGSTLARLSRDAGAHRSDGSPLRLRPHDCRRVFATEHLNNHTPVHVIQALLGHAHIDTVMVYAKLYPSELVESYRRAMLGVYRTRYGTEARRIPSADDWAAFSASCSMRDMGTHLCALPTGDHCTKGLVCLGCAHAQPKKSATPTFRRMLASHQRSLLKARAIGEPAGQLAARELEVDRLEQALARAIELNDDAAQAIEASALPG